MRILLITAAMTLGVAAPAFADKAANCDAFAGIAGKAVDLRSTSDTAEDVAARTLQEDATGTERRFLAEIPMIVSWIYTLPEEQLTPEVAEAARAQCMAAG